MKSVGSAAGGGSGSGGGAGGGASTADISSMIIETTSESCATAALPTDFIEAPPGAFSFDPGALGQPAPEMLGQP